MNLRHAVALALAGWYLVVPPISKSDLDVDFSASLPKWKIDASFDSASDCETERARHAMALLPEGKDPDKFLHEILHPTTLDQLVAAQHWAAKCVSTDDPRLKAK